MAMYMNPSEIKWGDAPPVLPKGAKMAVLSGDPGKPGPFVARLQVPASYKIAPHYHSTDEDLTVISGSFHLAEGDKMETKGAHEMKAGGFQDAPLRVREGPGRGADQRDGTVRHRLHRSQGRPLEGGRRESGAGQGRHEGRKEEVTLSL
jgi:hypothetical protein